MSEPNDLDSRPGPAERPGTRAVEGSVTLAASPERVWQALTDARELERWFPLDAQVEPGAGGSIRMSWRNEFDGTMKILVWEPPHHLRTAWSFSEAEEPAQVTDYLIEAKGGATVVRVVTSGFPMDSSWDGWVEGTERGWAFELRSLKRYLEHHDGEGRQVVYLRRRVSLSRDTAWKRLHGSDLGHWLSAGDAFDERHASQYAAIVSDPLNAMFRISVEPGAPGSDQIEIVLFLSAWGDQRTGLPELERAWARQLIEVFPEGSTP